MFSGSESAHQDWIKTILYLNNAKSLSPKLTLRIYFLKPLDRFATRGPRRTLTFEQAYEIQETYYRIVKPLAWIEQQPRRFLVHAAWPGYWTEAHTRLEEADSILADAIVDKGCWFGVRFEWMCDGRGV